MKRLTSTKAFLIYAVVILLVITYIQVLNLSVNMNMFHSIEKTRINNGEARYVIEDYDSYLKSFPYDSRAYLVKGDAEREMGKSHESAASYKKGHKLDPKSYYAHKKYADQRGFADDPQGAIEEYGKLLKAFPDDAPTLNNRAYVLYLNGGDLKQALEDADKSLELGEHEKTLHTRAAIYNAMGRYKEAITDSDRALELNPDTYYAYYEKGYALLHLNRKKEGLKNVYRSLYFAKKDNDRHWIEHCEKLLKKYTK